MLQRLDSHTAGPASHDATPALEMTEPGLEAVNVVTREDIAPDGGYGWVCAACVFFINAHTWGVNSVRAEPIGWKLALTTSGMGNLPLTLPRGSDISRRNTIRICSDRRALDIAVVDDCSGGGMVYPTVWHQDNVSDWHGTCLWVALLSLLRL